MIIGIWQRVIRDTRQPLASGKESSSVCTFFALNLRPDVAFSFLPSTNGDRRYRRDPWPSSSSLRIVAIFIFLYPTFFRIRFRFFSISRSTSYDATILLSFLLFLLFFFPPPLLLRDAVTKGRHLKPCFKEGRKATRIKIDGDKGFDSFF